VFQRFRICIFSPSKDVLGEWLNKPSVGLAEDKKCLLTAHIL